MHRVRPYWIKSTRLYCIFYLFYGLDVQVRILLLLLLWLHNGVIFGILTDKTFQIPGRRVTDGVHVVVSGYAFDLIKKS